MKKSFMTRALATGLSLAMAFSLSAATNVTTAAAAAKPAMKSSKMTIKVGQSKNYQATAATQKSYKISKIKLSAAGKAKVTAKVNSSKKSIKLTGKAATKSTNVVITFKNNKTKKLTKVTTKAVVKEAEKPDEAYKINSATATGVKTITVELNKAVANAPSLSAIVKKGAAARESKFTVDGSKIIIAMDAKLTAGNYTVTLEGLEATALTADVNVEKDETLTSFDISDYIVAKTVTNTTTGVIKFAALNQYGEKMATTDPTVSCSFGTVANQKPSKSASATAEGEIEVTGINPVLAIVGTKGTVVLVGDMGVTATKEISYNTAATASTVEVAGTYHVNSAALKNITENDTIADYELLLTAKDQYGYSVDAEDFTGMQVSLAGGLTNIQAQANPSFKSRTVEGVEYIAMPLEAVATNGKPAKAQAGDATLTIVNPNKGLLITTTITVVKDVVITSLNITADNGIYEGQSNDLNFEAIDADGKSVTSYAVLSNQLDLTGNSSGTLKLEKNSDGTAKMTFEPNIHPSSVSGNNDKNSLPATITVKANSPTGGNYLVKTFTFTVYQTRVAKSVTGIAADTQTSVAKTGESFDIPSTKLILADQYSNKVTSSDKKVFNDALIVSDGVNPVAGGSTVSGTAIYIVSGSAIETTVDAINKKIVVTPAGIGTATVYMKYVQPGQSPVVSAKSYEAKFNITVLNTENAASANLEIKSINEGFAVASGDAINLPASKIKVVAKTGGVETQIPTAQYKVIKNENNTFSSDEIAKGVKSKTAKVTIQVTTWDSNGNNIETELTKEYEVGNTPSRLYKVTDVVDATSGSAIKVTGGPLTANNLVSLFKFKNQYGDKIDLATDTVETDSIGYKVELKSATVSSSDSTPVLDGCKITTSGQNSVSIQFSKAGYYTLKVTAVAPDGSTKDCTVNLTVS